MMRKNLSKSVFRVLSITAIFFISIANVFAKNDTIAIIDAGSSGSRLYIYCKNGGKVEHLDNKSQISHKKPLSQISTDSLSVINYLKEITRDCESKTEIPMYVLATAGMRLVDNKKATEIYDAMKGDTINGYYVKQAMTISGRYEGLYAWIALNKDSEDKKDTQGIIEIGGASMQITYKLPPETDVRTDIVNHKKYGKIYSKSYLNAGVNEIYNRYKNNTSLKYDSIVKGYTCINNLNSNFIGLGKPLEAFYKGSNFHNGIGEYINKLEDDNDENFHPKSNAYYFKWLFNDTLPKNLEGTRTDISWTKGAAIDILINKNEPEEYNNN